METGGVGLRLDFSFFSLVRVSFDTSICSEASGLAFTGPFDGSFKFAIESSFLPSFIAV